VRGAFVSCTVSLLLCRERDGLAERIADECVIGQRGGGGSERNCDWRGNREEQAGGGLVMGIKITGLWIRLL
jgi:hypothetical protein